MEQVITTAETEAYIWTQNNSGGAFEDYEVVIVFATTHEEALDKSREYVNIYYDGVLVGSDCECCGDRWHLPDVLNYSNKDSMLQDLKQFSKIQGFYRNNVKIEQELEHYAVCSFKGILGEEKILIVY